MEDDFFPLKESSTALFSIQDVAEARLVVTFRRSQWVIQEVSSPAFCSKQEGKKLTIIELIVV